MNKITTKEKLSYALANIGNIPVMTLINGYLLIFYTNVCGLAPADCATLFLIARILDALNDPIVGFIIDHAPTTKHGHFRPTLMIGALLCSLNFLLLWFGPMMAGSAKLLIAYLSYLLIGFLFPVMDISLNSLLPVMTEDMQERNSLSSIKGLAYAAGALVIGIAAPLVLGDTSNRAGYIRLILIFTAIIFFFSVIGAAGVKERVHASAKTEKYKLKDLFRIITMRPVLTTFLTILLFTIGSNITSTVNTYFYTYVMNNLPLMSLITVVSLITLLPAIVVSGRLIVKYGKKKMYLIGLLIMSCSALVRLINVRSVPVLILSSLVSGIGSAFVITLNYGIQADNTDYVELQTGYRAEGAVSSLSSFISKFAAGIGGAIPGYMLAAAGFESTAAVQSPSVITTIIFCVIILPALFDFIGVAIFGKGYPLNKEKLEEQNAQLLALHETRETAE